MSEEKTPSTDNSNDLFAVRMQKLKDLRAAGTDPFAENWEQTHTSKDVVALYEREIAPKAVDGHLPEGETGPTVSVAGRLTVFRVMGKASFVKILDRDGVIQLYFKKDVVGDASYDAFKKLDVGDIIGATGTLFKSKTGEVTVRVSAFKLLSKALRPLPEKWHGIKDPDQIYRQRYLDLIMNPDSRARFFKRSDILREIRSFLWSRKFVEVEVPILQNIAGGAAARPFITHMNALNCEFYMRIAPELFLKRMLVGGFERVFELGRVFRNEGLSRRHNPEFTMLEVYQAYSDYRGMMQLIYDLVQHLCKTVLGGQTRIPRADGGEIELGGKWREVSYRELIIEATGDADWFSRTKAEKLAACERLKIDVNPTLEDFAVTQDVYEKIIEPSLIQPTFVTHIPHELCPLAKLTPDGSGTLDVFELCINGQEVAPAYSEQNDPILQRAMLEQQVGEEKQNLDEDFLVALEHGMPPAGGMGVGIDRLVILLTGAASIRDVILYPALKPQTKA